MEINYKGTLISVKDIEKSKKFYMDLFDEETQEEIKKGDHLISFFYSFHSVIN